MDKQERHVTTMRLTRSLWDELQKQGRVEARSTTSLIEEAGWMLLTARGSGAPLERRIGQLTGEAE